MNEKKIKTNNYELEYWTEEEVEEVGYCTFGDILFPVFMKKVQLAQEEEIPLEEEIKMAEYLLNIKKEDKVYKDFIAGIRNFHNNYLTKMLKQEESKWEYEKISLEDDETHLLKYVEISNILIKRKDDKYSIIIKFWEKWTSESGYNFVWIIQDNQTKYVGRIIDCSEVYDELFNDNFYEQIENYASKYKGIIPKPMIEAEKIEKINSIKREKRKIEKKDRNKPAIIAIIIMIILTILIVAIPFLIDYLQKK